MFTKMAHEAFMKLKQVRRRSWGGGYHIYVIYWFMGFPKERKIKCKRAYAEHETETRVIWGLIPP